MAVCKDTMDAVERNIAELKSTYAHEAKRNVDLFIGEPREGYPSPAKYKAHKELYDLVYKATIASGELQGFSVTPFDTIKGWKAYLNKRYVAEVNSTFILSGTRRVYEVLSSVKKVLKKREANMNKFAKTGRMKWWDMAVADPLVAMHHWEPSGIGARIVLAAQTVTDSIQQYKDIYYSPVEKINSTMREEADSHIDAGRLILGNAGVGEIRWPDANNRIIYISDTREVEGQTEFKVRYEDDTVKWITRQEARISRKEFREEYLNLISDKFPDEIANGQVREIVSEPPATDKAIKDRVAYRMRLGGYVHSLEDPIENRTYYYVMVKHGEAIEREAETYHSYFVAYVDKETSRRVGLLDRYDEYTKRNYKKLLSDGFYKSEYEVSFLSLDRTFYAKEWRDFRKLDTQPNELIIDNIHKKVRISRGQFREINRVVYGEKGENSKNEKKINTFLKRIERDLREEKQTDEYIENYINEIAQIGGIDNRAWRGKDGNWHTGNTSFIQIDEQNDYMPRMYRAGVISDMLLDAYDRLDSRIRTNPPNVGQLKEELAHIMTQRKYVFRNNEEELGGEEINRVILGRRILFAKHRQPWTKAELRRKDAGVINDYIEQTFRTVLHNRLVADLAEAVYKLRRTKTPEDVIKYIANKVKQGVGDSNTMGNIGDLGSHAWMARQMNKFTKGRNGKYTTDSAKKITLFLNGLLTSFVLGAGSAMTNNTQVANSLIIHGSRLFFKGFRLEKSERWRKWTKHTGVENMLSVFEEHLLRGEKAPGVWDFPFIPGTALPSNNMVNMLRLLSLSRERFILHSDKNVDNFLKKLSWRASGERREDLEYLARLNKQRLALIRDIEGVEQYSEHDKELLAKRAAMYDLYTSKSTEQKILKAQFENLAGKLSDGAMRRMITWKLDWWPEGYGEELFAFTKAEKRMRRVEAIIAVLEAQEKGDLAVVDRAGEPTEDIYRSRLAVEIARNAVYAIHFGMSLPYMGNLFDGLGRMWMIYKGYSLAQIRFDWNNLETFIGGSSSEVDKVNRLVRAQVNMLSRLRKQIKGQKGYQPEVAEQEIDYGAERVIRTIWTRGLATVLATTIGLIPFLSTVMRNTAPFGNTFSSLRGAENPAAAIAFRLTIWTALMAMGAGGDDEDRFLDSLEKGWAGGLLMLTTPALLSIMVRGASDTLADVTQMF